MATFVKHQENRRTYYLIPLPKKFGDKTAYLDYTDLARDAIRRDRRRHYGPENGPLFGIETLHAMEYAEYVAEHAIAENIHKFNTRRGYSFFISAVTDDQIQRDERRREVRK